VAMYKDLTDVESGFRQLKDVLAMRPIYPRVANLTGSADVERRWKSVPGDA